MIELFEKVQRRKLRDHKDTLLVMEQPFLIYLIIAVVALFGVETYYQNCLGGDSDTTYIGGFWSYVCGISLFIEIFRRRSAMKWYYSQKERDGVTEVEERLIFDDQGLSLDASGFSAFCIDWALLWKYKESKKMFHIKIGGNVFQLRKKFFSVEEVDKIRVILAERKASQLSG